MASPSPTIPPDTAATGSLGPFPTPTHGQPGAGSFTIACSAHIKAAPRTCLEVLLKASEYATWNRYCRKCIIDAQPDGDQQKDKKSKSKSKKEKDKSKPKAGKPREPVDLPVPVAESVPAPVAAPDAPAPAPGTLSTTNSHSTSSSASSSDQQALPNLVGPEFLRLGTKFTFHVHMDPLSEDSSARNTALEVSRLERIDEVVEADASTVSGSAAPLPSAGGSAGGTGAGTGAENGPGVAKDNSPGGDVGGGVESQNDDSHHDAVVAAPVEENAADNDTSATTKRDEQPTDTKEKDKGKGVSSPQTNNKLQLRRTGFRIAWKTRPTLFMPNWMLRCERVQEFVEVHPPFGTLDEPETAYQCWETFYGVLAPVVKAAAGSQIMRGFDVWMEGLKKRAEGVEGRGE